MDTRRPRSLADLEDSSQRDRKVKKEKKPKTKSEKKKKKRSSSDDEPHQVYRHRSAAAEALDAADGVIDGHYFGSRIVEQQSPYGHPQVYRFVACPNPRAPQYETQWPEHSVVRIPRGEVIEEVVDHRYNAPRHVLVDRAPRGHFVEERPALSSVARRGSVAEALDAADGVIDGRYYGTRIVERPGTARSTAEALDAADGVIDGRYYGARIVEQAPSYVRDGVIVERHAPTFVRGEGYYVEPSGRRIVEQRPVVASAIRRASAVEVLDAADGVIDGRHYGSRIVHTGPEVVYGNRVVERPTTSSVIRRASVVEDLDAADGVIDGRYYGTRIVERQPNRVFSSTAAALDAADGVIDGQYYGARIVEAPRTVVRSRSAAAEALDAADGVIDGKYFGSRIVEQPSTIVRRSTAEALDAADGVIDGRYYGARIVERQPTVVRRDAPTYVTGTRLGATRVVERPSVVHRLPTGHYGRTTAEALDAADGVIDGRYFGARIVDRSGPVVHRSAAAEALDAADGVIDGRHFGARIVEQHAPVRVVRASSTAPELLDDDFPTERVTRVVERPTVSSIARRASAASALDAADGVIDGRYFGARIVEQRPISARSATVVDNNPRYYSTRVVEQRPSSARVMSSTAAALDAADGVIDGRYYGARIVETGRPATATYARSRSAAAEALDAADGVIDGRYFGSRIVESHRPGVTVVRRGGAEDEVVEGAYYRNVHHVEEQRPHTTTVVRRSAAAEALDAADGVIDGKYFGSRIVEGQPTIVRRAATSAAEALDAADGVIDGRYFGSRIVEQRPATAVRTVSSTAAALDAADGVMDGKYYGSRIVEQPTRRVVEADRRSPSPTDEHH